MSDLQEEPVTAWHATALQAHSTEREMQGWTRTVPRGWCAWWTRTPGEGSSAREHRLHVSACVTNTVQDPLPAPAQRGGHVAAFCDGAVSHGRYGLTDVSLMPECQVGSLVTTTVNRLAQMLSKTISCGSDGSQGGAVTYAPREPNPSRVILICDYLAC